MNFLQNEQTLLIKWVQEMLRGPGIDAFFRAWNFVDTADFLFLLIPFIWVGYQRKLGLQIFYGALLSGFLNATLKEFFQVPRPLVEDPSLGVVQVTGLSFPSGAAQTAIWLPGLFILHFGNHLVWALGVMFGVFLSFSRVYLGLHYPLDLLGGWGVGLLVLFASSSSGLYERGLNWWENARNRERLLLSLCAALVLLMHPNGKGHMFSAVFLGVQLGLMLDNKTMTPHSTRSLLHILLRGSIGLIGICLLTSLPNIFLTNLSPLQVSLSYFLCGLWLSCGAAYGVSMLSVESGQSR